MKRHSESVTESYVDNKDIVPRLANIQSKKLKNVITGYVTRLKQREQKI